MFVVESNDILANIEISGDWTKKNILFHSFLDESSDSDFYFWDLYKQSNLNVQLRKTITQFSHEQTEQTARTRSLHLIIFNFFYFRIVADVFFKITLRRKKLRKYRWGI